MLDLNFKFKLWNKLQISKLSSHWRKGAWILEQRKRFQDQYKEYALSKAHGSILDVKERSRSRSLRARNEIKKKEGDLQKAESMAQIMRTSRDQSPNQLALK